MPENENALKHLFGPAHLRRLAAAHPDFDRRRWLALASRLEKLEMKPRVRLIRDELHARLPREFPRALKDLLRAGKRLEGFDLWPYMEYIQLHGLEHPALSLEALRALTPRFTAEWAVRPFLKSHPRATLAYLRECARDPDPHVRRWASEGSRPRLPWGERLQDFVRDPSPTLPILEALRYDPELYVRKSVANHLNDIAKDHPALVVRLLREWQRAAPAAHAAKIDWTIRRALRTLIKAGHGGALGLIGVARDAPVEVAGFKVSPREIRLGEHLAFEFEVRSRSDRPLKLVVDYVVHFVKANGGTAPKVFKLKEAELAAGETTKISKRHHFKEITTRRHYPGAHALEIQINGVGVARKAWTLKA